MSSIELTILMPCLNEAETLACCIRKAKQFLQQENIKGEILIADNGSVDGSQEIARQLGASVISVSKKGYGAALNSGIKAAQGRYIIMGDADNSYDFFNLMPFLQKLREGYDLVMGNRFKGGILKGAMPFLNRYLGNPLLSFIGRLFFHTSIRDFHCGLRGFHRERLLQLNLQGEGMEFASEMVVKATLQQFNITEVPTQLFPDGRSRPPHLRPFRDGLRHLRLLLLLCPRWLFFYPGMMLILMGMIIMSSLLAGPLYVGGIHLDIHTLLFGGLFMIVGLQAMFFSIFAKFIEDFHFQITSSNEFLMPALKRFILERSLVAGLLFILIGCSLILYTIWYWFHHSFGPLLPTYVMRILIPGVTFLILGMQFTFAGFFMNLLTLYYPSKRYEA